jgi:hypothetical protein
MAGKRRMWALLALAALLAGCGGANTYGVRETGYVAPAAPAAGSARIYVFRENSAFGAARKFAIIDNDTVMAVLTPGTFSYFEVPAGQHEIVAYMAPSPLMHYRATPASGETVYLMCKMGYASGIFIERIDAERANALMPLYRYTEIGVKGQKARMNYKEYYDRLYN